MARLATGLMRSLWKDGAGVTAIEYVLIVSLIAMIIIAAVTLIGTDLSAVFNQVANSL